MQYNRQPIEKREVTDGQVVQVHSIFHTIQGEGPFAGAPAVFVRLAGCNLQCPMCDTDYTARMGMTLNEISSAVYAARPRSIDGTWATSTSLVVITGGEPFRQSIGMLVKYLTDVGYTVQIETNGTLFDPTVNVLSDRVFIVCSPKTGTVHRLLLPWVAAFKYVATADSLRYSPDGLPMHALEHPNNGMVARPPAGHPAAVYLQPVDEQDPVRNQKNVEAVVSACLRHGHRLCLQLHKIVNLP